MKVSFSVFQRGKIIEDRIFFEKILRSSGDPDIFHFGIFESLRTYRGRIFQEAMHLERLAESAKTSGFKRAIDVKKVRGELRNALKSFLKKKSSVRESGVFIRLTLWGTQIFVLIGERSIPRGLYEKGIRLQTSPVRHSLVSASPPEVKSSAYLNSLLAGLGPRTSDVCEKLFLDGAGFVMETCVGNIFAVKAEKLWTPPVCGILNGVTRRFVIKCAHEAGIWVVETPLTRHEIFNAEEVFLTNTSWELLPVSELDGRKIGRRVPGPVTRKLQHFFKQKVEKNSHES